MTHQAILSADRGDRRKSPSVPGAAMTIFADRHDRRINIAWYVAGLRFLCARASVTGRWLARLPLAARRLKKV